jgi:hypothetical protein
LELGVYDEIYLGSSNVLCATFQSGVVVPVVLTTGKDKRL